MRAEHRVSIVARTERGEVERRSLHGVIAVERPDRFRLRALGPGGITLFDLLYRNGQVNVIQSLRDPSGGTTARLVGAIAADLAAAFDLLPRPAARRLRGDGSAVFVSEPDREIRLLGFTRPSSGGAGSEPIPTRIEIDDRAGRYRVTIDATDTVVDEPLDPALFRP